ncbi:MAG: CBS domain-containing protein [Pyrinomonadaceae bacterium]|nr:CBS domain-containing protein [Phycisphaerales bacterium]
MNTNDAACIPHAVASIMTRHVISVSLDTTLRVVRQLFELHRVHHLPVLEHGKLVGIVSDRDMLKAIAPGVDRPSATSHDLATLDKHVHQFMKRGILTARPLMSIAEAGQIMLAQSVSALPVLDEHEHCVGIISSRDFMKWCLQSGCPASKAA